jgi:hypothetical protein
MIMRKGLAFNTCLTLIVAAALCVGLMLPCTAQTRSITMENSNLFANGDFEYQSLGLEILNRDCGTWSFDESIANTGRRSLRLSPSNSAYPKIFYAQTRFTNIKGHYYFEGYLRIDEAYKGSMPQFALNVFPVDSKAGERQYITLPLPKDTKPGTWVKLQKELEAPVDSTIYMQITTSGSSGSVWMDGLFMTKVAGKLSPGENPRLRTIKVSSENFVKNGGFESDVYWDIVNASSGKYAFDTTVHKESPRSLRLSPVKSTYGSIFAAQQRLVLPAGEYYFEGFCQVDEEYISQVPSMSMGVSPKKPDEFKRFYPSFRLPADLKPNEWAKASGLVEIPAEAVVYLQLFTYGGTGSAFFDDIFLGKVQQ